MESSQRTLFEFDSRGILVRRAPVDGTLQAVILKTLRARLLHAEHYHPLSAHPGMTRMYELMRRYFYWPGMPLDIERTVQHCSSCSRTNAKWRVRANFMKLFPASAPLEFVGMYLLGPLPKTQHEN